MFRIRSTGQVKSQGEIRKMYPNISLPSVWDVKICNKLGIDPVLNAPHPTANNLQTVIQDGVKQDDKGNWIQNWVLRNKFSDYTNDEGNVVTKAEQETAFLASETAKKAADVRTQRDKLLAETDWMVIKAAETGATLATDWATYRQALRDISSQDDFPDTVIWPTKPE